MILDSTDYCLLKINLEKEIVEKVVNILKEKTIFVCSECGNESPKWLGKKEFTTDYPRQHGYSPSTINVSPSMQNCVTCGESISRKRNMRSA